MPGKQMAIDADLNAGLIGETKRVAAALRLPMKRIFRLHGWCQQVRARRCRRGHPILFINIIGGMVVGVLQHGLSLQTAATLRAARDWRAAWSRRSPH
jgi:flagellar biosynthesis protein FlhA